MNILTLALIGAGAVGIGLLVWLYKPLRVVVASIFRRPTKRTVLVRIDGDVLELTGVSQEDQDALIKAFLARHSASTPTEPGRVGDE